MFRLIILISLLFSGCKLTNDDSNMSQTSENEHEHHEEEVTDLGKVLSLQKGSNVMAIPANNMELNPLQRKFKCHVQHRHEEKPPFMINLDLKPSDLPRLAFKVKDSKNGMFLGHSPTYSLPVEGNSESINQQLCENATKLNSMKQIKYDFQITLSYSDTAVVEKLIIRFENGMELNSIVSQQRFFHE